MKNRKTLKRVERNNNFAASPIFPRLQSTCQVRAPIASPLRYRQPPAAYRCVLLFRTDPRSCFVHYSLEETSALFHDLLRPWLVIQGQHAGGDLLRPHARVPFLARLKLFLHGDGVSGDRKTSSSVQCAITQHRHGETATLPKRRVLSFGSPLTFCSGGTKRRGHYPPIFYWQ